MPKQSNGPWFRESKQTWYATVEGKQTALGVKGEANEADAVKAWHRLMAGILEQAKPKPKPEPMVSEVVNDFLADAEARVKPNTVRLYRYFLKPFAQKHGSLKPSKLSSALAEGYARKPGWNDTTKHNFLGSLASAFRWAERTGLIDKSPLIGLRRPPAASRGAEAVVSPHDHARLMEAASPSFRAFLQLLWLTGARPGEIASLTAGEIDLTQGVAVLTHHKTAYKGKSRTLYLCTEAVAVLRERIALHPQGLLFRGERKGVLFSAQTIGKRLSRLCVKAGVKPCIAYGYRHTFATEALANGVPDAQVAALLGHSGTAMLHKHYSHLTGQSRALREALSRVR